MRVLALAPIVIQSFIEYARGWGEWGDCVCILCEIFTAGELTLADK